MTISSVQMLVKGLLDGLTLPAVGVEPADTLSAYVGIPSTITKPGTTVFIKARRLRWQRITEGRTGLLRRTYDVELNIGTSLAAGLDVGPTLDRAFAVWVETVIQTCHVPEGGVQLTDLDTGQISVLMMLAESGDAQAYDPYRLTPATTDQRLSEKVTIQAVEHYRPLH